MNETHSKKSTQATQRERANSYIGNEMSRPSICIIENWNVAHNVNICPAFRDLRGKTKTNIANDIVGFRHEECIIIVICDLAQYS